MTNKEINNSLLISLLLVIMLSYEEFVEKSQQLDNKINESLAERKILESKEVVSKSKADYQRSAYIKKLHEKLNMVILSRNKAQEANKRLLADFDRIQRHMAMMEEKTGILINKVNHEKDFLDINYPNWRERANMFVSPSYISRENMFNMLDSLHCRLKDPGELLNGKFPHDNITEFSVTQDLASMLNKKEGHKKDILANDVTSRKPSINKSKDSYQNTVSTKSQHEKIEFNRQPSLTIERTVDTLTNITESVEIPLAHSSSGNKPSTPDALSPRQSLDLSLKSTTENFSMIDPLENSQRFSYMRPGSENADESESGLQLSSSEGNIENMLSPQKQYVAVNSPVLTPDKMVAQSPRENILDSPGGSVDTVIKSPMKYQIKNTVPKLAIPIMQVCNY